MTNKVDAKEVEVSIALLNEYVNDESIRPLILVLEELIKAPDNKALIDKLSDALNNIGVAQGAVLTYAPYISVLISKGLFEDD